MALLDDASPSPTPQEQLAMNTPSTTEQLVNRLFSLKQEMRDAENKSTELAKRELAVIAAERSMKEELGDRHAVCAVLMDDLRLYGIRASKIDVWFAEIEMGKKQGKGRDRGSPVSTLSTKFVSVAGCRGRFALRLS